MNTIVVAWVLVVSAQNSPIISPLVADLASCERIQRAISRESSRSTQCVEVKVLTNARTN